jgi:hypothetical protein
MGMPLSAAASDAAEGSDAGAGAGAGAGADAWTGTVHSGFIMGLHHGFCCARVSIIRLLLLYCPLSFFNRILQLLRPILGFTMLLGLKPGMRV